MTNEAQTLVRATVLILSKAPRRPDLRAQVIILAQNHGHCVVKFKFPTTATDGNRDGQNAVINRPGGQDNVKECYSFERYGAPC